MQRKKVWIESRDQAFARRLAAFLDYHYGNYLEVHPFEAEELKQGDILLTDRCEERKDFQGLLIPLTQEQQESGINAFQSGHSIARELIAAKTEKESGREAEASVSVNSPPAKPSLAPSFSMSSAPVLPTSRQPILQQERHEFSPERTGKVICVFSPVGGSGKSTFARALAQMLQEECEGSVLLLSLETASDWRLYYRNESEYNLSDLLYCLLESEAAGFLQEVEKTAVKQTNGVYFIKPATSYRDLRLIHRPEWEELCRRLTRRFAYVVFDLEGNMSHVNETVFNLSDRIYVTERKDTVSGAKMQAFREQIGADPELYRVILDKEIKVIRGKEKEAGLSHRIRGDKKQIRSEETVPEEKNLYSRKDGKLEFAASSAYLKCVRELVQRETGVCV